MPLLRMLRDLLEDRFRLVTHFEKRQVSSYALVLARRDGILGPHMQRRSVPCTPATPYDPKQPAVPLLSEHQTCGGRVSPGAVTARGATMANLVSAIARFMPGIDRVVIDRTRLTGTFDIDLTWNPDTPLGGEAFSVPTVNPNASSLVTALQEQLGLKLESTKSSVDVLVIDRAEHPTPN